MKISLSGNNAELMGIFGFSWPEKVAAFMQKRLKGTALESKLKSFWGAGGKNVQMIENLHREYIALMAQGKNPVSFALSPDASGNGGTISQDTVLLAQLINTKTAIDKTIIEEFLRAIFILARDGKIPYEKWNPKGYSESEKLTKTFTSEQNIFDKIKSGSGTVNALLLVAGIGVSAYLLSQLKGLTK
jgi:hypothetical protein